ncbi:D-alanyl-D-alanine carboxypeptidase family protein [Haloferula sp. A504]|uniref:D-alanyl-D-alanine carboxypeptidase family protein n=1 Tax=Haloferula sp. A504 TaxID=3373601 RepID=UPI0031BEE71A|nr:D-alanyl-D-alanine carboxypeptidase [Verrucomicrobiaceae bacterium E54]
MFRRFRPLALLALAALGSCGGEPQTRHHVQNYPTQPAPPASDGVPAIAPPQIYGESAIVIDARSGKVFYAKNADSIRPVASTQKIITALVVLDAGSLDKRITIENSDTACEPTKLYLRPGEVYTRGALTKALMVKSGNDVARALARDIGGSQEGFSALMNRKAASLGMRNSNFINPNGLPAPGQYSTARDIAIAARHAYRSGTIRSWTNTQKYTFQYASGRTKVLENTNKLLKSVPYCDGMKTGTTNRAGRCLVATGTYNGRSAITVVLKSNSRHVWDDSEKLLRWALESPRR